MSVQVFPTIYLVRHATPDWSRTDIPYHLPPGPPLTPQGESEAAKLGDFLRDMRTSQVLCSPLVRCLRTAEIAAEKAGVPHTIDNRLAEVQPQEKPAQVLARVWPAWVHVGELCLEAGPVVLLTHGGPINVLLEELGLPAEELKRQRAAFDRGNPLPPAGAWRAVRPSPDGPWSLELAFTPEAHRARAWFV